MIFTSNSTSSRTARHIPIASLTKPNIDSTQINSVWTDYTESLINEDRIDPSSSIWRYAGRYIIESTIYAWLVDQDKLVYV